MTGSSPTPSPSRVTDLVALKQQGAEVVCRTAFEILPVDFQHRDNPFQAYIFLCRYSGEVDRMPYAFRKCYARGCPHNLCPHVSQAILIANGHQNRMMFLMVDFAVTCLGRTQRYERCLASYPVDIEKEEKAAKAEVANSRLRLLYEAFARAGVACEERLFPV